MHLIRSLLEIIHGIDRCTGRNTHPNLKVQVVAGRVAGAAHSCNDLALLHAFAYRHIPGLAVGIHGIGAVVMLDHHHIAVAAETGAGITHHGNHYNPGTG